MPPAERDSNEPDYRAKRAHLPQAMPTLLERMLIWAVAAVAAVSLVVVVIQSRTIRRQNTEINGLKSEIQKTLQKNRALQTEVDTLQAAKLKGEGKAPGVDPKSQ